MWEEAKRMEYLARNRIGKYVVVDRNKDAATKNLYKRNGEHVEDRHARTLAVDGPAG